MNNEPVAWMLVTGHGTKILEKKPYCAVDYWIPLYTHPAKELHLPWNVCPFDGREIVRAYAEEAMQ